MKRPGSRTAAILTTVLALTLVPAASASAASASAASAPVASAPVASDVDGSYGASAWNEVAWEILWRHRGPILKCGFPLGGLQRAAVQKSVKLLLAATRYAQHSTGVCATAWTIGAAAAEVVRIGFVDGSDFYVTGQVIKEVKPSWRWNRCEITIWVGTSPEDAVPYDNTYRFC